MTMRWSENEGGGSYDDGAPAVPSRAEIIRRNGFSETHDGLYGAGQSDAALQADLAANGYAPEHILTPAEWANAQDPHGRGNGEGGSDFANIAALVAAVYGGSQAIGAFGGGPTGLSMFDPGAGGTSGTLTTTGGGYGGVSGSPAGDGLPFNSGGSGSSYFGQPYSVPGVEGSTFSTPSISYPGYEGSGFPANYAFPPGYEQAPAPVDERGKPYDPSKAGASPVDWRDAGSIASAAKAFLGGGSTGGFGLKDAASLASLGLAGRALLGGGSSGGGGTGTLAPLTDPSGMGPTDAAAALRKAEADRAARVAASRKGINDQFGQFGDDYYKSIADSYKGYAQPLLDEKATEARRVLPFGTATTAGSAYQRQSGNLERDVARSTADIGQKGVDIANQRRSDVESNRANLLSQADAGADTETLNAAAADRAKTFATPPPFSPIADLFSKYSADAANGAIYQNMATNGAGGGFGTSAFGPTQLLFPGSSSGRSAVRNVPSSTGA